MVSWVCWGLSQNQQISGKGFVSLIDLVGLLGHVSAEGLVGIVGLMAPVGLVGIVVLMGQISGMAGVSESD